VFQFFLLDFKGRNRHSIPTVKQGFNLGIFQQFWMIAPAEILGVANVYHGFVHQKNKSRSFRVISSDLLKLNRLNPYFPSGFDVHITPHHDAIRPTSIQAP
jgi:hypothetical protein